MVIPQRHLERKWAYSNLFGLLLGFLIGHCIILFSTLFTGKPIELSPSARILVFSVIVSVSVANSVSLFGKSLIRNFSSNRSIIIGFYLICLAGMVVGTELSYLILSAFFDMDYSWVIQLKQIGINSIVLLIVCSSIVLYEWQKTRHQINAIQQEVEFVKLNRLKKQAELQTIQAKVNPHFLYNSLNAIAGLIGQDGAKAESMTLKLAQLYRYSLAQSGDHFSSIEEELNVVKNYLEIEQVRFGKRFKFEMICEQSLFDIQIPRFLLQPLLENAVKHGLSSSSGAAVVKLHIRRKQSNLDIAIYDNGQPFPVDINCGYGFKSTYDKLKLLYGDNYQIRLINHPEKHIGVYLPVKVVLDEIELVSKNA